METMETKQVIIIRKDLNMRKGKMIAQGCHASMKVVLDKILIKNIERGMIENVIIESHEPLYNWLIGLFTKIVVGCNSEEELLELKKKADDRNIINALITDVGKTEFNGIPTHTALAIGPHYANVIDDITGHLKLL